MATKKLEGSSGKTVAERTKSGPRKIRRPPMLQRKHKSLRVMWREMQRRYADGDPAWFRVKMPKLVHVSEKPREGQL